MGSYFPALAVQPPRQADVGQLVQLSNLLQNAPIQRQILQQQAQAGQLENQLRQKQIQDQQTLQGLAQSGKYVTKDSQGNVTGFDYDKFGNDATAAGIAPATIAQVQTMRKNAADTALAEANVNEKHLANQQALNKQAYEYLDGIRGVTDPAKRQSMYQNAINWAAQNGVQGVNQMPQQVPDDNGLNQIEMTIGMHAQSLADAKTAAETAKAQTETQKTQQQMKFYQGLGLAEGVTPEMAGYAAYIQKGGTPEGYAGFKAGQEAAAKQPYALETARVEAQTKQLLEGYTRPGYAFNPATGQTQLTNQSDYLRSGGQLQAFRPVTEKEVSSDAMLINRLGDVHQKLAEYEQALQKPVSPADKRIWQRYSVQT